MESLDLKNEASLKTDESSSNAKKVTISEIFNVSLNNLIKILTFRIKKKKNQLTKMKQQNQKLKKKVSFIYYLFKFQILK